MTGDDLLAHLARFARALREHGVEAGIGDEIDAAHALALVDLVDRAEVHRAFQIAFKIRPRDRAVFDDLFHRFWSVAEPRARLHESAASRETTLTLPRMRSDRDHNRVADGDESPPAADGTAPGYTRDIVMRRKPFEECSARDLADMERLLARLARRWAARRSRRVMPVRGGRGLPDLRRSLRRAVGTGGEMLSLARRARALEEPRLVVLCDTSGSMDVHVMFLLAFVLALTRVATRTEVFAFNTSLIRLTPWLSPGRIGRTLDRLATHVPGWSGGTRIGE